MLLHKGLEFSYIAAKLRVMHRQTARAQPLRIPCGTHHTEIDGNILYTRTRFKFVMTTMCHLSYIIYHRSILRLIGVKTPSELV